MRRIFSLRGLFVLFVLLLSIFSFAGSYEQASTASVQTLETAAQDISLPLTIPDNLLLSSPGTMYGILRSAAQRTRVNLFRTNLAYTPGVRPELTEYVLLTGPTRLFDSFHLVSGHFLTVHESQSQTPFLSSAATNTQSQVGVLQVFAGQLLTKIRPLRYAYGALPFAGNYQVEAINRQQYLSFVHHFTSEVNQHYHRWLRKPIPTAYFMGSSSTDVVSGVIQSTGFSVFTTARYALLLLSLILLVYLTFYQAKRLGIMKMHGGSNLRIWFLLVGNILVLAFVLTTALSVIVAALIEGTTTSFIASVLISQVITYLLLTAVALASYAYIVRIKVLDAIKNRTYTRGIFVLNVVMKAVLSVLIILAATSVFGQYGEIRAKQQEVSNWLQESNYGVFYPLYTAQYLSSLGDKSYLQQKQISKLYPLLNKMGSIFIDASEYERQVLALNESVPGHILSITVNPNYLKQFPVRAADGHPIQISNRNRYSVLLVPEKYRARKDEILSYFERRNKMNYQSQAAYGHPAPAYLRNPHIHIIRTANHQEIFSFDPNVFPSNGNRIVDPIIKVLTEKNSLGMQLFGMVSGGGGTEALKIRLIDGSTRLTMHRLEPYLKKYHLRHSLRHLVTVDQFILQQVYNLQQSLDIVVFVVLGLLAGLLVLITQNLALFFHRHRRRFVVRRLFGAGILRTYKEYIPWFLGTWALQFLVVGVANTAMNVPNPALATSSTVSLTQVLWTGMGLMVLEFAASLTVLSLLERRNRATMLKEEV